MTNAYPADVQVAHEAVERAVTQCMEIFEALAERESGPGGRTFGTEDMDRSTRIEQFMADAQSGALDILKTIAPKHYEAQVRQFESDVAATPVIRGI